MAVTSGSPRDAPGQGRAGKREIRPRQALPVLSEEQQADAAARVGAKPLKHYAVGLNGFATSLTPDQARTLQRAPGVLSVTKDQPRKLASNKNPVDFLKLSGSSGVWAALRR